MSFGLQLSILSAAYLLWYGYRVFVKDRGNPGGIGLVVAVLAWGQILGALFLPD